VLKKKFLIAVFLTVCLATTLLAILSNPTRSQPWIPYDPWMDVNDDGEINILDMKLIKLAYGSSGTPINKTALLLELQARIDSLNASLVELQSRIEVLEANYSVTNTKLAPYAIPFNSTYSRPLNSTSEKYSWVDMPGMSVTITVNRTSHLLIMFSTEATNDAEGERIWLRALVDTTEAKPGYLYFTPSIHDSPGEIDYHYHLLNYMAYTYNFIYPSVHEGTYTIKIQWRVTGGTGTVMFRTLTVIALPA